MKVLAVVYLMILGIEYILAKREALREGVSSTFDWLVKTACWEEQSKTFQVVGISILISPVGQMLMFAIVIAELWIIMKAKKGA